MAAATLEQEWGRGVWALGHRTTADTYSVRGTTFCPPMANDCVSEYDTPSLDSLKYSFRAKINFRFQLGTAHDGPKLGWI